MTINIVTSEGAFFAACAGCDQVGFHGTSSTVSKKIEAVGFLPDKIFTNTEHKVLIEIATSLGIDTSFYLNWLGMTSVTFARQANGAMYHLKSGSAGGQGLKNMEKLLQLISDSGHKEQQELARDYIQKIKTIRNAMQVLYAVDLSGFGPRIVIEPGEYHYFLDPSKDYPVISDIGPSRLIARLDYLIPKSDPHN